MILPIYAYGHPVLRRKCKDILPETPGLHKLIKDMYATMYNASGVGLAAPQIGRDIRLFVVDTLQLEKEGTGIKKVFINAHKVKEIGQEWDYEEGCLSIPDVNGEVSRPSTIRLRYLDEQMNEHTDTFEGMDARVIQHEYDHIEGVLFTDLLKPLKKKRVQKKLDRIKQGKIGLKYPMFFMR